MDLSEQAETVRGTMITKRNARLIRAGITAGRKFVALARYNPGLASGNLKGIYGDAYSRTVLRSPRDKMVRVENADPLLGRDGRTFLMPGNKKLTPGARIECDGISGTVIGVHDVSDNSDLVALVDWDDEAPRFEVSMEPLSTPPTEDESLARAWAEGWHAHYLEWEHQRRDPSHPITQVNPYATWGDRK